MDGVRTQVITHRQNYNQIKEISSKFDRDQVLAKQNPRHRHIFTHQNSEEFTFSL